MNSWWQGLPALLSMQALGGSLALWAWRGRRPLSFAEWVGWSWLLGSGALSFLLVAFGSFLPRMWIVPAVMICGAALAVLGWQAGGGLTRLAGWPVPGAAWEKWLALGPLIFAGWAFAAVFREPLAWDGLLIWEYKAHVAFASGGHFPLSLFHDASAVSMHPGYPLYLPLTELWVYLCSGRADQTLVKVIFPPFYLVAAALIWGTVARRTGRLWAGAVAAMLPAFVPNLLFGGDVLFGGYADFPLGAFYLAALCGLLLPGTEDDQQAGGQWALAGAAAALLPWVKQEGMLLWAVFAIVAAVTFGPKRWRLLAFTILPGLVVLAAWKASVAWLQVPQEKVFYAIGPASLDLALARFWPVALYLAHELGNIDNWALLWYLAPVALLCLLFRRMAGGWPLAIALLGPLALDLAPYLFTRLDLQWHLQTSCARLVLQDALLAVLAVGVAIGNSRPVQVVKV